MAPRISAAAACREEGHQSEVGLTNQELIALVQKEIDSAPGREHLAERIVIALSLAGQLSRPVEPTPECASCKDWLAMGKLYCGDCGRQIPQWATTANR